MRVRVLGRLLVVAVALLFLLMPVYASGRAGARVEVRTDGDFSIRVYAEEVLLRVDRLELTTGVDYRLPENWVTPYTAFNYYADAWWISVEVAGDAPLGSTPGGFRVSVAFGAFW